MNNTYKMSWDMFSPLLSFGRIKINFKKEDGIDVCFCIPSAKYN